jgi:hypothetical protein
MMKTINKEQLKKLHVLLGRLDWMDDKKNIVEQITGGRTQSSRELTFDEAKYLLQQLSEYDPAERMKSLIFSLAYRAGIIYGSSEVDKKLNTAKLNMFLKERGAVKKELHQMTYPDLVKTHRQFEAVVKNVGKSNDMKAAGKLVANLMEEINANPLNR